MRRLWGGYIWYRVTRRVVVVVVAARVGKLVRIKLRNSRRGYIIVLNYVSR
jgi:hypothetical protein